MKSLTLLSLLLVATTALNAQVKFSATHPQAGQELTFTYDPSGTTLAKSTVIKCRAYAYFPSTYLTTSPAITTISLVKDGAMYKGVVPTTDSTTLVALAIYADEAADENPNGYYVNLSHDGKPSPDGYIAEANLMNQAGRSLGIKANLPKSKAAYEQAFISNPALKNKWLYQYLSLNYKIDKVTGEKLIKEHITQITKNGAAKEKDLIVVYNLQQLVADKTAAAATKARILKLYPAGTLSYEDDVYKLRTAKTAAAAQQKLDSVISKYQLDQNKPAAMTRLSDLYYYTANKFAAEKNNAQFDLYAAKITNKVMRAGLYNAVAWPLAEKNDNTEFAAAISKKSLDALVAAKDDRVPSRFSSKEEYFKSLDSDYGMFADTYALLLYRLGKYKEAQTYQEKAFAMAGDISPDMNARYVTYLNKNGEFDKAFTEAEKLIETGGATDSIKNDFKILYTKLNKQGDYNTYLAKLEESAYLKEKTMWLKKMIDMPAPAFSLTNLKGEKVSLAEYKGKTVIVDYWATWCGPCVASFPGMQKAIDKYKDNPDVVFLFINTWQHEDNREQVVKNFINNTKYTFNVLLDTKNKQDPSQFDVISQYKVEGIPTKFVIDGKGNIRFKAVGFSGSADGVVKELDMMIGLAANASQVAKAK